MNIDTLPRPEENSASSLGLALEKIEGATDVLSSERATEKFLDAVGNNHAGTYFPVVLAVIPQIEMILRDGRAWAQCAALEALIDLCGSFEPEPSYEFFDGVSLAATLMSQVQSQRLHIELIAHGESPAADSAVTLLELLE